MRRVSALLVVLALGTGLSGCSGDDEPSADPSSPSSSSTGTTSPSPSASETPTGEAAPYGVVQRLLRQRAAAILRKDRAGFVATTGVGAGRTAQLATFAPLTSLPLAKVSYDLRLVDPHGTADATRVEADMRVQIRGFDPAPLPVSHVLSVARGGDGWRIVSDTADRAQISFAPWLLPHVKFTLSDHTLVVFDRGSAAQADRVSALADQAVTDVSAVVPYRWSGRVVIFAPSNTAPLRYEGFDPVEIHNLGGVAFPIRGPDEEITGSRIVIAPVMLEQDDRSLLTVLRHEVAHVAIGTHASGDPVWVVEGIAEYVAQLHAQTVYISRSAVQAADDGIEQMPPDGLFHTGDWGVNYGIAWFSMKWLADHHGEDAPFELVDLMHDEPGDFHQESRLLREHYRVTTDQLAVRAGELIRQTFD